MMPWQWVMCSIILSAFIGGVWGYVDGQEIIYIRVGN